MPELTDEVGRLDDLLQPLVGQALDQRSDPARIGFGRPVAVGADVDAGSRHQLDVGLAVGRVAGREPQQLDGPDRRARSLLVEQLLRSSQSGRVDLDPAVARPHQRGAGRLGAGHLGVGDRRVVDDGLPFDECLLAEAGATVVLR